MADQDISKQLDKLRNAFRKELRESVNDIRLDALYQQLLMQHVFESPEPLAAMTSWSIAPEFAWWLFQHVTSARPEKIIELGSGTSTLVIAAAVKRNGKGRFLSFEHDYAYLEKTRALLQACDLQDYVELLYAPLEKLDFDDQFYRWYDLPYDLIDHMVGHKKLDLLLVDGPPAATNRHARYPAMIRLRDYCSDSTLIILDDAAREEEQEILARWSASMGGEYAHKMLSNVRHGPALFYPVKNSISINVCEEIPMSDVGELVVQEVEQLVECALSELQLDSNEDRAKSLLDAFYRLRERSLSELKFKCAGVNEQCRLLEAQVESLSSEKVSLVAVNKQNLLDLTTTQSKLDEQAVEVRLVSEQVKVLETSLVAAHKAQALLEQEQLEQQARIAAIETERDEQLGLIEGLKAELVAKAGLEQEQQAQIAAIETERDEQLSVIEGLKAGLVDIQGLQDKLAASIEALDCALARELDLGTRLQQIEAREVALLEELEVSEQRAELKIQAAREFVVTSMQSQLDSIKRVNEQQARKLEAAKKELAAAILDRNALKAQLLALTKRYRLVYKSLVYQLGMAFYRQTRGVMSWAKIPLAISRVMRRHSASGNPDVVEYEEPLTPPGKHQVEAKAVKDVPGLNAFDVNICSDGLKRTVKGVKKSTVLWVASQIADEQGYQAALQFAETRVSEMQQLGLNLLRANTSLSLENEWLKYFNAYLKPFSVAPVSLASGSGTRFSRLRVAGQLSSVEGPLISVIMPAFNSESTLKHAAESILSQTWRNVQLIIVDDCSTDGTWEIAQQISTQDSRVLALRNAVNVGPYVSKNLALRMATGEYITGQDADDWSHPQRLQRDIEPILASNGKLLATLSGMLRMNQEGEFCRFSQIGPFSRDGARRVASISMLINAGYLRDVLGGWDSVRFGADSELIIRAEKIMGEHFARLDHIGMFCLDLDTSLTNDPAHGVCKVSGISPTRKEFRDSFRSWHSIIDLGSAKLPFPHVDRKFNAPSAMLVPLSDVQENIETHALIVRGEFKCT